MSGRMPLHVLIAMTLALAACSSADDGGSPADGQSSLDTSSTAEDVLDMDASPPEDAPSAPQDAAVEEVGAGGDAEALGDTDAEGPVSDAPVQQVDAEDPVSDAPVQQVDAEAVLDADSTPEAGDAASLVQDVDDETADTAPGPGDGGSMASDGDALPEDLDVPLEPSLCEQVTSSNEGCRFTAVTTSNPDLGELFLDDFAVVLANRLDNPAASVTITQGDVLIAQGEVAPGQTQSFALVMVSALVDEGVDSVLAPQAAYEITTDVPVTAAQFAPLHFQVGEDFTMSNDASLLLPHHALTESYTAFGFPAWAYWIAWRPGFIAVAATVDDTEVTVTASSPIAGGGLLAEMAPGDTQTVTLHRGDVLQLLGWVPEAGVDNQISLETCDGPGWEFAEQGLGNACQATDLDLTGTTVSATAPVAVFNGHSCLRVPYDAHACDHVEEQLFPDAAWGQEAVLTAPESPDGAGPSVATYRVVARDDDTTVSLSPPVAGPFTLAAGEQAGFTTDQDVRVAATGPILAVMALHSAQGLEPPVMDGSLPLSDPSIGLVVPLRQARDEYVFLTPSTYQSDWVNVVAFAGSEILVDGVPVTGWTAVGTTPYAAARVPVTPGNHHAQSADGQGFTLMSYGHANHTSYLYPGGLNLDP